MESRLMISCLLALILLVSLSSTGPVRSKTKCSSKCDESRNLLNYVKGNRYVYDFKNLITTHIPEGTREQVKVSISARAEFHVLDKCEITLTVKDAKMTEAVSSDGEPVTSKTFTMLPNLLEKYPLPFGFNDGRITGICNSDKENRKALNVKKAMISQFQISMEQIVTPTSLTERDISGDCLTEYQYDKEKDDIVHINKMKAILGCANRKVSYSDLRGQNFFKPTETSQMPLLKGHQKCSLQVSRKGHLVSSTCVEQQVFKPFSGKKSGATFDVEQTLTLVKITNDAETYTVYNTFNSLLMVHNPTGYRNFEQATKDLASGILKKMCEIVKSGDLSASKSVVNDFPKLVRSLRFTNVAELKTIVESVGKSVCGGDLMEIGKRIILDALPMIRTSDSAILMLDELSKGGYKTYRRSWLFSLATIRQPERKIIEKLSEIGSSLDSPLTVSSIVNTYCNENHGCFRETSVLKIVKQITDQLEGDCSLGSEKILIALRAIGNLGAAHDWNVINNCLKNRNIPMGHRVSAAQAIRHLSCDHNGWKTVQLLAHFLHEKEDPELRITSYLSLMACPQRANILRTIINRLDVEKTQQVGSFVWTHLSNLLETSQVFRRNLQNQLRRIKFNARKHAKKFNLDPRRYSRNFEKSYYNKKLNSGVSVEGNVIYSDDSFIPRSTTFNMTGGLFGKSISLFELGLRTTNLDGLIRKGMKADFPPQKNAGSMMLHFDMSNVENPRRTREEPSIDLYMRLFGNELIYKPNIKPAYYLAAASKMTRTNLLKFISDNPISFSHTRMVMEAVISVPTVAGLPLELSLDVASSMDLYSQLKIDKTESDLTIKTDFKPKAGLGVVGRMRLDAHCTEIGVEFHGSAFTNTEFGGEFKRSSSEMSLLLNAPQGKQTVIDLKSRMVLVSQRQVREQENMKTDSKTTKELCSGKRMEAALGLKICGTARYAQVSSDDTEGPSFPFTGRNEMSIRMDQVSDIKKYKVKGTLIPNKALPSGVQKFEIELNTEGSSKDRKILMSFNDASDGPKMDLSLLLRSPKKRIYVSAKGDLSKREMNANLDVDDKNLAKLTSSQTIGDKRVTTVTIDIAEKKKYIEVTLSSDNTLSPTEFDHSLKMETKGAFKSLDVSVSRTLDGDSTKYSFDFGSEVGKRSFDVSFKNKVKFDDNSQLMISNSNGDIAVTLKKEGALTFKYSNIWKMVTTPDKLLEEKEDLVTEHSISFDQTLLPEKYSKYNIKGGSLVIQHNFLSGNSESSIAMKTTENAPSKKLLNLILKAESLKFSSENTFSGLRKPFVFETYNSLTTKKLDLTQSLEIRYSGWKDMRLGAAVTNKGKRYLFALENVIDKSKVLQAASLTSPKLYFNARSELKTSDDTGTLFEHSGEFAWSREDSYSSRSTITWGLKDPESHCSRTYQMNGKAFKKGKLLGDGYINICPDVKKRKASFEIGITNGTAEQGTIMYFLQDGTFKTDEKDFHVGVSTTLTVPGKVDFDFSTNHIYYAKENDSEVSSNFILNTRTNKSVETTYGYKLRLLMKQTEKKTEGSGKIDVQYPLNMFGQVVQTKSTYKASVKHEPNGNKHRVEQTYIGKSVLWGETKLDLNTDVTIGEKIEFKSEHTLKGTLELENIYEIDGTQKIEGTFEPFKELDAKGNTEIKVVIDEEDTKNYKHNTNLEVSLERDSDKGSYEAELELKFESNYPLKSFTYDSTLKRDKTSLSTGYDLEWNYNGTDYKSTFDVSGSMKDNAFSTNAKLVTPLERAKLVELGGNVNLDKMTSEINGNYNGKAMKINGGIEVSKDAACTIYGFPDAKLTVTATPNENITKFKSAGVTLNVFYKALKFFDLKMNLNGHDAFKFAAGLGGLTNGFEIRNRLPLPKIAGGFDAVLMFDGAKPDSPAPVFEVKCLAGKLDALLKSTATKSSSDGFQYKIDMNLITKNKTYVSKNTALVLDFEKTDLSVNKGKISMQKGEDAAFDIQGSFDYNFSFKDFLFKTNTDYTFFDKERRVIIDLQSIFELSSKKRINIELIPNRKTENKKLSVLINHDGTPLWNFDVKVVASLPAMKSDNTGYIRFFYSPDGSSTTKSDLITAAVFACDLKLSSTTRAIKIQAAFSKDKKGEFLLSGKTNSLRGTIDAGDFPNFVVNLSSGDKTMVVTFTKDETSGRLIASSGGKQIGSADVRYESGKQLKIGATITLPDRKPMELRINQQHGAGDWNWRDWSHTSYFSLWTKEDENIKLDQKITFQYLNDELNVDTKIKSTLRAIKVLNGKLKINTGSTPSSFLSLTFKTFGGTLKLSHDVPEWKNILTKFVTDIMITGPKMQKFTFELKRDSEIKAHLKLSNSVFEKFKLLQYTRTKSEALLKVEAFLKRLDLKTNIISLVYDRFKESRLKESSLKTSSTKPPNEIYITGTLPKYGKLELRVKAISKNHLKIKMKLGKYFLNISPKWEGKCCKGPIAVSLQLKMASHWPQFSSCNVILKHASSADLLSLRHKLSVYLNGKKPFSQKLNYIINENKVTGNYDLEYKRYAINAEATYTMKSGKYSHNIKYGYRNRRIKIFATTADCEPYAFGLEKAKCELTATLSRQKMVFLLKNTAPGSKIIKSIKIAWNDYRKQSLKLTISTHTRRHIIFSKIRLDTPLRNFELIEEYDKRTGISTKVSGRTLHKRTGAELGHFTVRTSVSVKGLKERTILRVTSTLFKKEIKFVTDVDTSTGITLKSAGKLAKAINVRSDMYIGRDRKSKLSLTFTMKVTNDQKKDLRLKLVGGKRYLDLFTRYDLTKPVKTISIGADAKDWKRTLDIVYENGKRLETTVATGTSKQTIKMSSERMAQNNGYRNILELDYPEVSGYLKIISQVNRYPLSLLVIVQTEKNTPENRLVVNGRFMNSRNLLFEVKRFKKSSITMDTYTQITLDKQNVITKFKWRPGVIDDIKGYILRELRPTKLTQYLKNRGSGLQEVARRAFKEITAPLKRNVKLGVAQSAGFAITSDYDKIKNVITFVKNFVVKKANDSAMIDSALKLVQSGLEKTLKFVTSIKDTSSSSPIFNQTRINEIISAQYQLFYAKLGEKLEGFDEEFVIGLLNAAKEKVTAARAKFKTWLEAATVKTKAWVKKRRQFLNNIKAGLAKRMEAIAEAITSNERAMTFMQAMNAFSERMKQLGSRMVPQKFIDKLVNSKAIKEMKKTMNKLRQLIRWSRQCKRCGKQKSDWNKSMRLLLNGDLKKAFYVYFKPQLTRVKTWDPKTGFINAQIHLPYNIKSLQSVPLAIYAYTRSQVVGITSQLRAGTFQLGKLYLRVNEEFLRYSTGEFIRRQLPPYPSYAYLTGGQHFVTFDGVNLEHGAGCTYILAHDYVGHTFTVLARYTKMRRMVMRKEIIVQTPNAAVFLGRSGLVKLKTRGSRRIATRYPPMMAEDLSVTRLKNRITLSGPQGLTVTCYIKHDVCRIALSKWSHARVNGLLGTNDYERGNDLNGPLYAHSYHWKAGRCQSRNRAVVAPKVKSSPGYRTCRGIFDNKRTSLGRCYFKVPPEGYMQSCLNMYKMKGKSGVCSIVKMYIDKCKSAGIQSIRLPNFCITCGKGSRSSWFRLRRPRMPDSTARNFIFIVEDKPCVASFMQNLKTFVSIMSKRNRGDRYAMISYGGEGIYRQVSSRMLTPTFIRGSYYNFVHALRRMEFKGSKLLTDPMLALKALQTSLVLDDDLTKQTIVVLLSCSGCKESSNTIYYGPMAFQLRRRGIRFHYITSHSFGTYGGSNVIGMDSTQTFGAKGKVLSRVSSLSTLKYRRDTCDALARTSGGSVWSIQALTDEGPFGLSKLKSVIRQTQSKKRRRCTCSGNNVVRCMSV